MRFFLLLASGLVEFAAFVGKWLFIMTAPVLLIVAGTYYQAGESVFEPISGLASVTGIFVATHSFSTRLNCIRPVGIDCATLLPDVPADPNLGAAEIWNLPLHEGGQKQFAAKDETRRANQRQAELWKQANPWGGYNPHE